MTERPKADDLDGEGQPDPLDDVREAAAAVVSSLKDFAVAAERVVADPDAFAQLAAGGRAFVEAFLGGFGASAAEASDDPPPPGEPLPPTP